MATLLALGTSVASAATNGVFSTPMNSVYHTPIPPNDLFPQNPEHVMVSTTVMAIIAIIFLFISIYDSRKFHSTVPVGMVMGAMTCVIPESVDNYLGGCFWSQSHRAGDIMFVLMGREFDWYVAIMWWAFGAILGYLLYAALLRGISTRKLWICLALSGIADIVLEEILLGYGGIYTYFGNQPLVLIHHFPWWWLFVNVSALFLSVSIAYRFRDWFNGWHSILLLFLMPFCYIGGFSLCGMPAIFAINGMFSPAVIQILGIATCIVSVINTSGIMKIVLGRNPFSFKQKIGIDMTMGNSNKVSSSNSL